MVVACFLKNIHTFKFVDVNNIMDIKKIPFCSSIDNHGSGSFSWK